MIRAAALGLVVIALTSSPQGTAAQSSVPSDEAASDAVERGAQVFRAAGCYSCHTDSKGEGAPLAGGRALPSPFGTFLTPNITPDRETGIGAWSAADLARALRQGVSPDGRHYYPAFPYTSYTGMTDRDVEDLWAYLMAQPAVAKANQPHDLPFPFSFRPLLAVWKALFFTEGRFNEDPAQDAVWNRGAYLVQALGHCGECHTPRGILGNLDQSQLLAGTTSGPDGKKVPNITPHPQDGIGDWSESDLTYFLKTGILADGDVAGGAMTEVIEDGTEHLNDADRAAIAAYLRGIPPLSGP